MQTLPCAQAPWRWLGDGEIMLAGDFYADCRKPVGYMGPDYNGLMCKWRNGVDAEVIRTEQTDREAGVSGKLYFPPRGDPEANYR